MNSATNVFQAVLVGYMQDGMSADMAHFEALVVLRGYLAASPNQDAAQNSSMVHRYLEGLLNPNQNEKIGLVLGDSDTGHITTIPRPECMQLHLPKDRKATKEEILKAWKECRG